LSGTLEAKVFATEEGTPVARCRLAVEGSAISAPNLRESLSRVLVEQLTVDQRMKARIGVSAWIRSRVLDQPYGFTPPVSVILATANRPHDLRRCLASLFDQDYAGPLEIVVVDNRPESGLTSQ